MSENDPIYQELAAKLGLEDSKYMPRILERLANLEQAKIVAELPSPSEEIARKLNLDKAAVDKHIQELIEKGLVLPTKKGPQMARSAPQLHDASAANPKFDESLRDEFFDLWAAFQDEEFADATIKELTGGEYPGWRCIPRWKSIKDIPGVLPCEDTREILKSQETIALVHCPCKRVHRQRECGIPDEMCITVGRTAQYNISRGTGRKLTVEEALQVIEQADEYPVVHLTLNQRAVNQLICNCHWCCCDPPRPFFRQDKVKVYEGIAKSRFQAVVDSEKCTACNICIDRCQFGATQIRHYPEFDGERIYIDAEKCMGCGCCVIACPDEALTMKIIRPPEHIPEAFGSAW